jgi:hypothetical protein
MKEMKHLGHSIILASIQRMDDTFNSHQLIQDIMTYHPQEYVKQLHEMVETLGGHLKTGQLWTPQNRPVGARTG